MLHDGKQYVIKYKDRNLKYKCVCLNWQHVAVQCTVPHEYTNSEGANQQKCKQFRGVDRLEFSLPDTGRENYCTIVVNLIYCCSVVINLVRLLFGTILLTGLEQTYVAKK